MTVRRKKPKPKRTAPVAKDERPANLQFWFADGACSGCPARAAANLKVSIGRTNSKRAFGFSIRVEKEERVRFVLDRDQVAELAAFLRSNIGRLRKPLGRKINGISLLSSPEQDLWKRLHSAAIDAHPGWHRVEDNDLEQDAGAPFGAGLVAWFKKNHPRKAARVEREFTERLWKTKC